MKNSIVFIFLFFSISTFAQQNKWNIGIVGGPGVTALIYKNQLWEAPSPLLVSIPAYLHGITSLNISH